MTGPDFAGSSGFAPGTFADRVALVTAAGGAICGSAAVMLGALGAHLVLTDADPDRLAAVATAARGAGATVHELAGDLRDPATVAALVELAEREHGRIDVLINGLGEHLASAGSFEETTEEQWSELYQVNLLHVFRVTKAVLPGMKGRGYGRIVNFSSVEGIRAAPDLAVYAAFKRAVDGFTRSLAVEVAPFGVLINAVAVDKTRAHQVGHYQLPPEYQRLVPTWIPAGHYAEPDEVARIVAFLAAELNTWIVGDTIAADGGTLAAGGWYRTPQRWTNQPLLTQYLEPAEVNDARPPSLR
ncbi:SDR family NAD(P)-dependent oxidoreductase [Nakamurella lactea]|uniref:SDR family NAD(P)-dependent oxidoreductase n=1 Tax=Nakamurella lactea TaxID=459515 RepID=UPI000426B8F3|nr:SDR family oxidoreductase [Nakamurella lactea]